MRPEAAEHRVDVRDVEPRHRFEIIMGAYRDLPVGRTFELVVDHDPTCMYYTLKADYGDEFFTFQYLEKGPKTWRVRVTKSAERA